LIGLLTATILSACVPMAQADSFGLIGFHEALRSTDERLTIVGCSEDGECRGFDRAGVVYYFWDGDRVLTKESVDAGPSAAFRNRLEAHNPARSNELSAPVCADDGGLWLELTPTDGGWSYALKTQP
jgi:hypothetical protein